MRRIFWIVNKFFMVPMFRLGLGPFMGNPLTGYIMVLKNVGRKSGKLRFTPVNYAIMNGCVYCITGFGKASHWYLNIQANPNVELILPSGPLAGVAEEVSDPEESLRATRQVLKNAGFAGFFAGFNPFTISDDQLQEKTRDTPVLRIRPAGVGSGASDAGGWMWLLLVLVVILWLVFR
jgi:deazaflavin-dependent oxidoreductase (nitroreductase family)